MMENNASRNMASDRSDIPTNAALTPCIISAASGLLATVIITATNAAEPIAPEIVRKLVISAVPSETYIRSRVLMLQVTVGINSNPIAI